MRSSTRREIVAGPAGRIECAVDRPASSARGVALIAHPHPLYGGTLDNKVVQTLARAFLELGYETWRPNFRGVGATEGVHDEGRGELEDLEVVLRHTAATRFVLAGFSFGAAVQARVAGGPPPPGAGVVGRGVGGPGPARLSGWFWGAWRCGGWSGRRCLPTRS